LKGVEEIMNRLNYRILALVILGMAVGTHWSKCAEFNIANGDVAGLKAAIIASNTNNEDDTINLAPNGNYVLTTVDNTGPVGPSGLPVIADDNGHKLTISGFIAGTKSTITRAPNAPAFRIFTLGNATSSNAIVLIDHLVITNGSAAAQGGPSKGGAIYDSGRRSNVSDCTISGNSASEGGGIFVAGNQLVLVMHSTLSGNSGGAVWVSSGGTTGTTVSINKCTISGNTADAPGGAAVRCEGGPNSFATAYVVNCTLNGNDVYASGTDADHGWAQVGLTSSILKDSPLIDGGFGRFISSGYNLCNDNGSGFLTQPADQINTDPLLDPLGLQDNGGRAETIALTSGSPAIDKGASQTLFGGAPGDERGIAIYDNPAIPNASGGDGSDVGAYEVAQGQDPVQGGTGFVVTTTDDHDDGVCGGADCTLREAVARANTVPGANSINFGHTLSGSITLTMGELAVTDSLSITGIPIGTISGNGASRVLNFTGGSSVLYGLTIRDGFNQINNFLGQTNTGGGVANNATLAVYGCSFINNHVLGGQNVGAGAVGGKGEGGAIYNSGTLLVDGSTFCQTNEASGGNGGNGNFVHGGMPSGSGGAGRGGAVFNDTTGSLSITNCTFNNNVALGGNGGSGGPLGGNGGNGDGGAIYNLGTITTTSVTISGNSGSGGAAGTGTTNGTPGSGSNGVTVGGGTATLGNTLVAANINGNGRNDDVDGTFISSGYNLIGNGDFSTGFNVIGDQVGTTAAAINPHLGPLQNNGGATLTMAPQATSTALDRGFAFGLTNDQRGHSRPFDDPTIPNAPGGDGGDIGAVEVGSGPAPTFVVSRKIHGANNQIFDIPLSADTLGDECRSGGANGDYTLVFTFAVPVTFTSASVCNGVGVVNNASVSGSEVTVDLAGVTSAEVLNVCLSNVSDGSTSGNVSFPFRVLVGDTTGNGSVNASDISQTKVKSGQTVDASNFRNDVTVNNSINASDVSLVKSRSGIALP